MIISILCAVLVSTVVCYAIYLDHEVTVAELEKQSDILNAMKNTENSEDMLTDYRTNNTESAREYLRKHHSRMNGFEVGYFEFLAEQEDRSGRL